MQKGRHQLFSASKFYECFLFLCLGLYILGRDKLREKPAPQGETSTSVGDRLRGRPTQVETSTSVGDHRFTSGPFLFSLLPVNNVTHSHTPPASLTNDCLGGKAAAAPSLCDSLPSFKSLLCVYPTN